jgi:DNA-3-methyladenine glycosylase
MSKVIPRSFFGRDARRVARELVGHYLVRRINGQIKKYQILETEAYLDEKDLASHARHGRAGRAAIMFGPPGRFYIYLVYGMHEMLNITTNQDGQAGAVLIRAVEGLTGPGKLTKALKITRALNNLPASRATGLWLEYSLGGPASKSGKQQKVSTAPRVGVAYAGPWTDKLYRYILDA